MSNHLVFFHQNYPAQFGPVNRFLLENYDVTISFFSEFITRPVLKGIHHYPFSIDMRSVRSNPYFFTRYFERECRSMYGAYLAVESAKLDSPDLFIGHVGFGNLTCLHVAYPDVPSIGFFELFYNPFDSKTISRPEFPVPKENIIRIPLRNAIQIVELEYCTRGYSPTPYQKSTYPEAYQHKLEVIFDGIDTELYKPGSPSENSELVRTWPSDGKIVTYVARGLEANRGFDIFMDVAYRICQKRNDIHFVIAGNPQTYYGSEMITVKEPSFKEYVMKRHPYDLSRFHFLNWISEPALVDLYRLSDCHFYWTKPFVLSWSFFQAMSAGALVVASNSEPVRDVLRDGENGLLFEPYEIDEIVDRILDVLDNPRGFAHLRKEARETILKSYSMDVCLPRLAEFYFSVLKKAPSLKVLSYQE